MVRIEQLPDDFDESLDLNKPRSTGPTLGGQALLNETPFGIKKNVSSPPDSTTPAMPPGMASVKSHTAEEILDLMNKTPLFMTDLSKATDGDEENIGLEAIRALQYEGTRAEVAQGLRESGNEVTREKKWSDGKEFYTKAIAVLTGENKWEKSDDPEGDLVKEREIAEACYSNRALCNLELKNYRSTTLDCASALKLNPKNVKAYYRSTCALFALDKIPEAEDTCARGLTLDPSNKSLQSMSAKISARKSVLEEIAAKRRAEEERARKEKLILNTALRAREIKIRTSDRPPELEDAAIHLSPDPLSPKSTLVFPSVFLYPMDAQSDFVKAFAETETIGDHLSYIFPLPWDSRQEYKLDSVDCFMETAAGGLIKVGKKIPLLKILAGGKVEVVDSLVNINIVPTGKSKQWIEEMKARKGA
ncbi:tetratricopeptide repeat domain-containing protein [Blastomyces gilchristii SLH14081]|uniref:Tetratricopeptide repeat domain-containing protein n=1 Tax=Blastomyces gilchristii (strain SLH14081) TaxID=559298 RepID=A0A179V0Q5_BLAGS|nr:tetratricopeptide repeat domain-containing protein [Blastomyces gilchristii SLH14081]OAT13660.1 tetratricopeptide repeat domain-containing protein [Blastomyces gilchristii SLH14081]